MFKKKVALLLAGVMAISALSVNGIAKVNASDDEGLEAIESVENISAEEGADAPNSEASLNAIENSSDNGDSEIAVVVDSTGNIDAGLEAVSQDIASVIATITGEEIPEAPGDENITESYEDSSSDNGSDFVSEPSQDSSQGSDQEVSSPVPESNSNNDFLNIPTSDENEVVENSPSSNESSDIPTEASGENVENTDKTDDTEETDVDTIATEETEVESDAEDESGELSEDATIDENVEAAIEDGVFAFNESDSSKKTILKAKNDEASEEDAESEDGVVSGSENGAANLGDASANNKKQIVINVANELGLDNNTKAGEYVSVTGSKEGNNIQVVMSGLTEGNKNDTVSTILDYYNQLGDYSLKLVNENYVDAEKYSTNKEDVGYDTQHCWAATSSNMLWSSGWAEYIIPAAETVDDVLDYYTKRFTDAPGEPVPALDYIFDGHYIYQTVKGVAHIVDRPEYEDGNKSENTGNDGKGFRVSQIASDFIRMSNNLTGIGLLERVAEVSVGAFLRWVSPQGEVSKSAHWLTAVGLLIDSTKSEDDMSRYKGIILADSDNDGARFEGSASYNSKEFSFDQALADKKSKTNSYTVYGLSTTTVLEKDESTGKPIENTYWSINNYLGNSASKAILTGFEYLLNYIKPDSGNSGASDGYKDLGDDSYRRENDQDAFYEPKVWEDTDLWDDWGDYPDEDGDIKPEKPENAVPENKPSDNKSNKKLATSGFDLSALLGNMFMNTSNRETSVADSNQNTYSEVAVNANSSAPMTQADIDVALQQAKVENAIDSLSASTKDIFYLEKSTYNQAEDKNYVVYAKGAPELVTEVTIDGVKLPQGTYKIIAKRGNVIQVVVSKAVLDKLAKGQHAITISYKNVASPVIIVFVVE